MNLRVSRPIGASILMLGLLATACGSGTPPSGAKSSAAPAAKPAASAPAPAPAPAAPAAAPAAPVPATSEKPLELLGKFGLTPANGPWGTSVTAAATGLAPRAGYDLVWTTVAGAWKLSPDKSEHKGREYKPMQVPIKSVTTDAAGAFTTTFTVPQDFGYGHDVLVVDQTTKALRNKSGFEVDMEVSISPKSGPVGTPITVEVRGIGWRQLENSWLLSYDNAFTGWISSVTTKGLARFVVPATGGPGTHILTILHGEFTFPYMNMQQSPSPNRPQFHIPFTVTDEPAVTPPPVAQQVQAILPAKPLDKGIWAAPASGFVGDKAAFVGRALTPNSEVELTWTTQVGNRAITGFEEQTTTLAKVRTDGSGSFAWSFTVPSDLGGAHKVVAKVGGAAVAETQFVIQVNALPLPVTRGPAGTKVDLHLKGVGWTETAQIYHVVYDNAYAGYACGFNTAGDVVMPFVISGTKGWHYIDVYPGIYRSTETRPQNTKVPQLTFADDHPAETLPAFHWAFYID